MVVEEPIGRQEPVRNRPECKGWAEEICTAPEDCTAALAEWAERRMPDERGRAKGPEWVRFACRDNAAMAGRSNWDLVRDGVHVHDRDHVRVHVQLRPSPGRWSIPGRVDLLLPPLRRHLHGVRREVRMRAALHLLLPLPPPLLHLQRPR